METENKHETIEFEIDNRAIDVYTSTNSFRPNRVSKAFIKSLPESLEEMVCYDIGSGGGIIAIAEALRGAKRVYAVEPAEENFKLLVANVRKLGLLGTIIPYQGSYFDPLQEAEKADIITADVSGIPKTFGRAVGWYSPGIDIGEQGHEITCELLKRAPNYIKPEGVLLFPTANDLLDAEVIMETASNYFSSVKSVAFPGQDNDSNYVWFPLRDADIESLRKGYEGQIPDSIRLQLRENKSFRTIIGNEILDAKGRKFWRGQIYRATKPL